MGLQGYLSGEDRESPEFRAEVISAVRLAAELGITYFDTAPGYGNGRSERILGEALEPDRGRVIVATKYPFGPAWTPESATDGLRSSLERLRTDCVDVLQLHGGFFSDGQADAILASGALEWAEAMRAAGRCRFTGITAEGPSGALERLLRTRRLDVLEIQYNLLYQAVCDHQREPAGIVMLARSLGMGVTTMRTATSGLFQRIVRAALPQLDAGTLTRLAINFVLSTAEIDCAIVGMCAPEEVAANAALASDTASRLDLPALHQRYVEPGGVRR
ncbi:MAG TPA: aldo/keto reductase, partial [Chthonomonadaceae bacterium]|nr:aldo/keto reductase [Chthonomonadaceae bacterium]